MRRAGANTSARQDRGDDLSAVGSADTVVLSPQAVEKSLLLNAKGPRDEEFGRRTKRSASSTRANWNPMRVLVRRREDLVAAAYAQVRHPSRRVPILRESGTEYRRSGALQLFGAFDTRSGKVSESAALGSAGRLHRTVSRDRAGRLHPRSRSSTSCATTYGCTRAGKFWRGSNRIRDFSFTSRPSTVPG